MNMPDVKYYLFLFFCYFYRVIVQLTVNHTQKSQLICSPLPFPSFSLAFLLLLHITPLHSL